MSIQPDNIEPDSVQPEPAAETDALGSIVDTILDLDQLLSADVRRAEDTYRLYRRPDLQAEITALEEQLDAMTDALGNPIEADVGLGEGAGAHTIALRIQELRRQYMAASGLVRLRQMDGDEWEAFKIKWKTEIATGDMSLKLANALVAATVVEPSLSVTNVIKLRQLYGATQTDELAKACWRVNTQEGVSVPKSPLSSHVLKQQERATN